MRAIFLLLVLLGGGSAIADRLHLKSGGVIESNGWWVEGNKLYYESPAGTIGIPRAIVARIESDSNGGSRSAEPSRQSARRARRESVRPQSTRLDARSREQLAAGVAALNARDFDTAASHYAELRREHPRDPAVCVGHAIAEIALGRDATALSAVLDGLAASPDHADLLELLGDLRYRNERAGDAIDSWTRAFEVAPNDRRREKILKAQREMHASRDYDLSATAHFNLRFDGDVDVDLAEAVIDHLEEQYWKLSDDFAHAPPQPITVQLFPEQQFRDVTQAPEWVGGLYDGKIRVPLGGLRRLNSGAKRALTHELTHAVVHSKTRGNCPRWLQEGLAQRSEGKRTREEARASLAREIGEDGVVRWETGPFSYPLALALTEHLESRRRFDGLVHLLDLLGEGNDLDSAMTIVFGESYAEVARRWSHALRQEGKR